MTKKRVWSDEARRRASERMKVRKEQKAEVELKPEMHIVRDEAFETKEGEGTPVETQRYLAKREFDYMDNMRFELGEIVQMRGAPNDGKLLSLSYLVKWDGKAEWEKACIRCGKVFGHDAGYTKHCAQHYETCSTCNKTISPERMKDHSAAHAELMV
jgi:hypothetical protein